MQSDALPVGGKLCRRKPGQPRHLAWVRGDHQFSRWVGEGLTLCQQLRGGVQAVCVQHRSPGKAGQKLLHQRAGLGGPGSALRCAAKAGSQQQNGSLLPPEQRHIFRRNAALCALLTGTQTALRQAGDGGTDHRLYACKGDDVPLWLSRARGGMLCQTNSSVISTAMGAPPENDLNALRVAVGIFSWKRYFNFGLAERPQAFRYPIFTGVSLYICPCTRARICFSTFCTSSWNIRADTRSAP